MELQTSSNSPVSGKKEEHRMRSLPLLFEHGKYRQSATVAHSCGMCDVKDLGFATKTNVKDVETWILSSVCVGGREARLPGVSVGHVRLPGSLFHFFMTSISHVL